METPATVGVDFEQGFVGVNGLAGNNPNLIDFTLDSDVIAPEELVLPAALLLNTSASACCDDGG